MKGLRLARLALTLGVVLAGCGEAVYVASTSTTAVAVTTTVPPGEVAGKVVAGPVCPVETSPPDPSCEDRPVAGAVIVVTRLDGSAVTEVRSDRAGHFGLTLAPGLYTLTPQPVAGLLGTAAPAEVTVISGSSTELTLGYDTGIRGPATG